MKAKYGYIRDSFTFTTCSVFTVHCFESIVRKEDVAKYMVSSNARRNIGRNIAQGLDAVANKLTIRSTTQTSLRPREDLEVCTASKQC